MAFYLAADPLEHDRINVFEPYRAASDVAEFRQDGPDTGLQADTLAASEDQHEIAPPRR